MTKQQKARAHLARAQELLNGQDTLAFGGVSDWSKDTRERKQFGGGPSTPPIDMENLPDDLLEQMTRHLDGDGLLWFREQGRRYNDAVHTLMQERTRGDQGEKNLINALKKGDKVMVNLLLQNGAQMTSLEPLKHAILKDLTDVASKIITSLLSTSTLDKGKIHIDHEIFQGHTALMYAIKHGKYNIAELLVERGANVNAHFSVDGDDTDGTPRTTKTPLDIACLRVIFHDDDDGFVRYLLVKGANPRTMGRFRYLINEDQVQSLLPDERKISDILRSSPEAQA